ncbi:uncharacterized protein K452DRAFT_64916 [Aplosporella prunicola CBS 121167]|uniref:Uncharacterized protein n=1 Tax=Aplosporella prunicola CBS 121167 TaxID=1176127 RepID=A0A6A6B6V0_9PEZI|nr:uncharacterized protein K452DRAFT_64916 [Aplosporella prunicola CBS 121167]KAF2139740.1 hypothetical protein K452DRAFT_64916 [Aplosporella prunicola CBS 121167]
MLGAAAAFVFGRFFTLARSLCCSVALSLSLSLAALYVTHACTLNTRSSTATHTIAEKARRLAGVSVVVVACLVLLACLIALLCVALAFTRSMVLLLVFSFLEGRGGRRGGFNFGLVGLCVLRTYVFGRCLSA